MPKETMHRCAADNEYLHRDFHGALSCGIQYLHDHFGAEAVRDYLRTFTRTFHAPLRARILANGLDAIEEHFRRLYEIEGGEVVFERSDDRELVIRVAACPAVRHIRGRGLLPAELFRETTATVNRALCEGTEFEADLIEYDAQTGRSVQRFFRRAP